MDMTRYVTNIVTFNTTRYIVPSLQKNCFSFAEKGNIVANTKTVTTKSQHTERCDKCVHFAHLFNQLQTNWSGQSYTDQSIESRQNM